jgi:predicted  nucleic acid-binding Zn-ribbon protein
MLRCPECGNDVPMTSMSGLHVCPECGWTTMLPAPEPIANDDGSTVPEWNPATQTYTRRPRMTTDPRPGKANVPGYKIDAKRNPRNPANP